MNKSFFFLLIILLSISSCNQKTKKHANFTLKKVKIGNFSFRVPEYYRVVDEDSITGRREGYLMVDQCSKMYFNYGGGIGSAEILNKKSYQDQGYTVIQDTTDNIIKFVAYKFDKTPNLEVHIAELEKLNVSNLFPPNSTLSNNRIVFLFNGMTYMQVKTCMTEEEMEVLAEEFMKGTVDK